MSIYRLLIHRFAVPLPSQGKAFGKTPLSGNYTNTKALLPGEVDAYADGEVKVTLSHEGQPNLFVDPENCLDNFRFCSGSLY